MTTIDKTEKPKILTESDQVLTELKTELANLKSRMSSIEEEQEQNKTLVERLAFQEDLANEMIANHQEEIKYNKENFQVIADAVNNLKSPVSNVVSNLSDVIAELDDEDTQKTLQECVTTASNVLDTFDDVEDFCISASSDTPISQTTVNTRDFFREVVSDFQATFSKFDGSFRLLIDKQVPDKTIIHCDTLNACLQNLVSEILHSVPKSNTKIKIGSEAKEQKYGIELRDLSITIEASEAAAISWKGSWIESIKMNQHNLLNTGFNLLKTRDLIRKAGGQLEILTSDDGIKGFKISVPLTY